jgi:hypothetical protein
VTICFGLAFSTLLVLVVMPAFLSVLEHIRTKAPAAATASEVT